MATGAIPIAVAASLAALEVAGEELPVFYVRESRKGQIGRAHV
jgi:orotate phosphoribosyltransferase